MSAILIYDGKCQLCQGLALKVQKQARQERVDLLALTDPRAIDLLDGAYPNGWEHDYYLFRNGRWSHGPAISRDLVPLVGPLGATRLLAELGEAHLRRTKALGDRHHEGYVPSRRAVVAAMAAAPLIVPLSQLRLPAAYAAAPSGLSSYLAEVKVTPGHVKIHVTDLSKHVGAPQMKGRKNSGPKMKRVKDTVLAGAQGTARPGQAQIQRRDFAVESGTADFVDPAFTVYNALLDETRYNVGFSAAKSPLKKGNEARGRYVSMAGGMEHDVASPSIDFVTVRSARPLALDQHLAYHERGVRALAEHRRGVGGTPLAQVYEAGASSFRSLADQFGSHVDDDLMLTDSKMGVGSSFELAQHVRIPEALDVAPDRLVAGCGCSFGCCCGCGTCLGCGCGLGPCIPPAPCGCQACFSCGCGCGYCCGCDAC